MTLQRRAGAHAALLAHRKLASEDFQLLERCAHSQAMRRLGNLRGHLDDESKKGKKRSLGVPGPGLIASSTRAWTTLLTNVADGTLDVTPSDRTSRPRAP